MCGCSFVNLVFMAQTRSWDEIPLIFRRPQNTHLGRKDEAENKLSAGAN